MPTNIPTASEAAAIIENAQYKKAQEQLEMVAVLIQTALANGARTCNGDGYLDVAVTKQLQEKGYKVRNDTHRNESNWSVSW